MDADEEHEAAEAAGEEVTPVEEEHDFEMVEPEDLGVAGEAEQILEDKEEAHQDHLDIAAAFAETGSEAPHQQAEETAPLEPIVTECAFIVYLRDDGHWIADGEHINAPLIVGRQATFDDFNAAAIVIRDDVMIQKTAQATVQFQQQAAAAMASQMQANAMAQQLMREGKLPGGAVDLAGGNRQQRRHPNG